jgi:hypothetical protein
MGMFSFQEVGDKTGGGVTVGVFVGSEMACEVQEVSKITQTMEIDKTYFILPPLP